METKKQRYDKRLGAMRQERETFVPHWRELADYFLPRKGKFLRDNQDPNKGDKRNQHIIDSTTRLAARTLRAGMMSGLTNPSRPWFRLVTPDPELMEVKAVRVWLYTVEQRMRDLFAKTNLYNVLPNVYDELGVFHTAAMGAFEDAEDVIRFYPYTIGSYYIAQNARLTVDSFYREFKMTTRQMVEEFGKENCSGKVQRAFDAGQLEQWWDVVYLVEPNDLRDPGKSDSRNMPFKSVWYEKSTDNPNKMLRESGFHEFPIFSPRWEVTGEDDYGTAGPGMDSLGDAKALQLQQKRKAMAIDKLIDPPLQAPSALRNNLVSGLPGKITYVDDRSGNQSVKKLYDVNYDLNAVLQDIGECQDRINRAFYVDLFLMLAMSDRREMTATEVAERHEEKLLMLGPVLERLNDELLDPLIDRTFSIMVRRSMPYWDGRLEGTPMIPAPPPELDGMDLRVEYISMLAQAHRMVALGSIERLTGFAMNIAQIVPGAMDKIDWDQSIDEYSQALSTPPSMVRSDDEVARIRQQRQQQEQQQAMIENAPAVATAAKSLSETKLEDDNALSRLAP